MDHQRGAAAGRQPLRAGRAPDHRRHQQQQRYLPGSPDVRASPTQRWVQPPVFVVVVVCYCGCFPGRSGRWLTALLSWVQIILVQFKMVSMPSETPIFAPSRLSEVSPALPLKRFYRRASDWPISFLSRPVLRKIVVRFLFLCLSPTGDRWCDVFLLPLPAPPPAPPPPPPPCK